MNVLFFSTILAYGLSGKENEAMTGYNAFIFCSGEVANYRVSSSSDISPAPAGRVCGTSEGGTFLFCASCLEYVKSCERIGFPAAWKFALEIRKQKQTRPY